MAYRGDHVCDVGFELVLQCGGRHGFNERAAEGVDRSGESSSQGLELEWDDFDGRLAPFKYGISISKDELGEVPCAIPRVSSFDCLFFRCS
jgi:hypothetical protein